MPIILQNNAVRSNSVNLKQYYYHLVFEQSNPVAYNLAKTREARQQWIQKIMPRDLDEAVQKDFIKYQIEDEPFTIELQFQQSKTKANPLFELGQPIFREELVDISAQKERIAGYISAGMKLEDIQELIERQTSKNKPKHWE